MSAPVPEASLIPMDAREFNIFRALIHRETGIYLRDGKQAMLAARLARRLRHHGMTGYAAYAAFVERAQDGGRELAEIINCVTTNKTSFFREMHHFDFLRQTLVPNLVASARPGHKLRLRVWSNACSTGEEPYSIAISLLDALRAAYPPLAAEGGVPVPLLPGRWELEVVASDIDTLVLAKASRGIYEERSLEGVPGIVLKRYFLRGKKEQAGQVRVKKEVREMVKFIRINLMDSHWPVQGKFDVIFFRNALIYFTRETQEAFLRRMLLQLKPGGYLVLGHAEHVPWLNDTVKALGNTIHQLLPQRRPPYTGPERRRRARC